MDEEEAPKSILERNNNDVSPKPKKKAHMKRMGEEVRSRTIRDKISLRGEEVRSRGRLQNDR